MTPIPKITALTLADVFRAQHTTRWHILRECGRTQSVAEHSFNVALIAREVLLAICSNDPTGRANFETLLPRVLELALVHDLPEVVLGDTVTITKRQAPDAFVAMERKVDPDGADFKAGLPKIVLDVVKVADLLDALYHLQSYPYGNTPHPASSQVDSIRQSLFRSLDERLRAAAVDCPEWADFTAVATVQAAVYYGKGTFIDDVFKEKPESNPNSTNVATAKIPVKPHDPREIVWSQKVGDYREQAG